VRYTTKLFVSALAGALGLLAIPAAGAHAETTSSLPLTGFDQMVVDNAGGYVFLSEGTGSEQLLDGPDSAAGIVVTDLSGNYVTTLDAGDGVEGLALSADGGTLYAALGSDSAVAAISVSSITATTTTPVQALYDLGGDQVPYDLALQSGELWVSYVPSGTGPPGQSGIGYFDLSQASPSFVVPAGMSGWYAPPNLSADPSDSGILVAAESQQSPAEVATYNVTGGSVTTLAPMQELLNANGAENCENESDLAVVPGGSQFIVACGWPYAHYYYSTADLSLQGQYASSTYPDAVAIDPGSGLVALGTSDVYAPQIYLYTPGGSTPLNEYSFPSNTDTRLVGRGLALSPGGSELYAVTYSPTSTGSKYSLHVFSNPAAALTLTGPATDIVGNSLTLTGTVTLPTGTPPPAGATLTVTRTEAGSTTPVTLPAVSTAADGTFTLSDAPAAPGTYTYAVSYGDSVAATAVVDVTPDLTTLSLSGPDSVKKGRKVTLTGTLTFDGNPAPAGTTVTLTRTWSGSSKTKTLVVTTNADGTFTVTERLKSFGTFTYTAQYAGSPADGPAIAVWAVAVPHPGNG
jgi:hypothetical protein